MPRLSVLKLLFAFCLLIFAHSAVVAANLSHAASNQVRAANLQLDESKQVPQAAVEKTRREKKHHARRVGHPVNINTATAEEINSGLVAIGPAKAAAIVEYREKHGSFKQVADLQNVKGIGPSIMEKNKEWIKI